MNDNEDQSPFGRGFVAASIVIAAVLLCGALLLITGLTSDSGTATAAEPAQSASSPASPGADPAAPATEVGSASTGSSRPAALRSPGGCSVPAGDQTVPTRPPSVDGWEVSRHVVVPRSSTHGPTVTDADGFRYCFAHSPTGAVYAAYNAIAAVGDQRQAIPTVRKLMVPGPDTDALIRALKTEDPSGSATTQLAGFRVLASDRDRVTVMLALPVESAYMSATLTLVWHDDDWRLQPPAPGDPVGAPFAQHRDLADFVRWSGI